MTTPIVFTAEPSSRRMVATAATQGVYSSVNTRKLTAVIGLNTEPRAELRFATFVPRSTASVETTASFAVKPEISAVTIRQSAKPRGRNTGAISCPMRASRLSALSATTFRRVSKVWRNQISTVAIKMTVKARSRKSFAFSHSSRPTLLRDGMR